MRSPTRHLAELIDGFLATQLLYVAAKLDVAGALAHGPLAPEAIAAAVDADPVILPRMLRGLAALGILDERPDGRVALTTMGESLRRDAPNSMRGAILARGELYYAAGASLLEAARRGGVPFSLQHGLAFFEYLAEDAGRSAVFQGSMTDRARQEAAEVVAAYDFAAFRRLVDVGGGRGVLLAAILNRAPDLRAVLLDQPAVVDEASSWLESSGVAGRCELVPGDFLAEVPAGGDAYLLSRVVHNWDDEAAVRILANCRRAMAAGAVLLLVEVVLPERATDRPEAVRMDLHMLMLLGGRERSMKEYGRLLGAAGFRISRVVPMASASGIAVIEAVAAAQTGGVDATSRSRSAR